jgi:alanine racemase
MTSAEARLTVDLDALAANHALLRRLAGPAEVAPVVKADAYGLGAAPVARRLRAEGARRFFVARVAEGEALRAALGGEAEIHVLDGCPPGAADRLAAARLSPVLNSLDQVRAWGARPAALHVDTGLNRLGVSPAEAVALAGSAVLPVELLVSHLSCAHAPDHPLNAHQREAFAAVRTAFPAAKASLANSGGLFLGEPYLFDVVRPGIALYGGGPFEVPDPRIRAVARFEAPILQVREVAAGAPVGYGAAFTAARPTRVAIVAAGYADGVLRAASPGGVAWFAGAERPLLGRVSMDLMAIDVTGCDEARPGAQVELLGEHVLLDAAAASAGTISYEILTRLSTRAERIWTGERG